MEHIPYEMSTQHMEEYLLKQNQSIIINEDNVRERIEWNKRILAAYYGPDHDNAHKLLCSYIDEKLDYQYVLELFSDFFPSMTEDKLEISVRLMSRIIKGSGGWDGTDEMLNPPSSQDDRIDPYLASHLGEDFCYSDATPEEVIISIRRFLYHDDIDMVRASLVIIYGWLLRDYFDNHKDFIDEIRLLGEKSNDLSIKKQVNEILDYCKKVERRLAESDE